MKFYIHILMEDRYVEWAQFYLLTFTSVLCFKIARDIWHKEKHTNYSYILFGFFCALVAIEEISWGQRLLGYKVPQFFIGYNAQKDADFHNVIGEYFARVIDYSYLLGLVSLIWGVVLPLLVSFSRKRLAIFERFDHLIPPRVLIIGFLSGALLMLDLIYYYANNNDEEIGELFIYMSLFYFLLTKWNEKRASSRTSIGPISFMVISSILILSISVLSTILLDRQAFNLSASYYYFYASQYLEHGFYKDAVEQYEKSLQIKANSKDFSFSKNLDKAIVETPRKDWVTPQVFDINGDARVILFEHPPSKITYKLTLPKKASLSFGIALNPQTWSADKGDGVLFEIYLQDSSISKRVFSKYIDSKNNSADRKWHDEVVDLSRYGQREVTLSFVTTPGFNDNAAYDWAGWSNPRLISIDEP